MRERAGAVGVVVAVLVLVAGGCVAGGGERGSRASPVPASSAPRDPQQRGVPELPAVIAGQQLAWEACSAEDAGRAGATLRRDADCSWLTVPVDYGAPGEQIIRLRVARVRAAGAQRLGSLVFNPGGPGEAGAAMVAGGVFEATARVMDRYDLVGFDPRGIGRSAPLKCPQGAGGDLIPRTREEVDAEFRAAAEQGENCRKASGALLAHMDTVSVARDLDVLRAALGESRLHYLGISYGTYIGQHYAHLFPGRVGRFVLDGVVDPATDQTQTARNDVKSLDDSFASYARACAALHCPLGGTSEEIVARTTAFVRDLDAHPVPAPEGGRLTTGLAVQGIRAPLYQSDRWPDLTRALVEAMAGRPGALIALAVEQVQVQTQTSEGSDKSNKAASGNRAPVDPTMARNAVDCLDKPGPRSAAELLADLGEFERTSPLFGATVAAAMFHCAAWPLAPTGRAEPLTAPGAPAMVLVSWAVDPATPLSNAEAVRRNLRTASLVVRGGTGHSAYASGSGCTDRAVDEFLVGGRLPPTKAECSA
ncbi:alpha/beta hydrolase [Streptomyces sp. NPDC053079]|uniref:alpha/beta hydrolase n=1 Tax=Streptomyces sp. NPDC053079 TaxID=3365697 RepID=UPI0037D96D94